MKLAYLLRTVSGESILSLYFGAPQYCLVVHSSFCLILLWKQDSLLPSKFREFISKHE